MDSKRLELAEGVIKVYREMTVERVYRRIGFPDTLIDIPFLKRAKPSKFEAFEQGDIRWILNSLLYCAEIYGQYYHNPRNGGEGTDGG